MNKLSVSLFAALLILSMISSIAAQEPAPPPKPGPEHERLGYFVGKWVSQADVKPTAFGPGGKFTYTEACEWLPGKFAILCKSEGDMMGGEFHSLSVMSYDTMEKSYIYYETNNWGENVYSHGSVDGDTWTWTNDSQMNGKAVRGRFTLKRVSDDSATFTFDMGMGSDPLANVMQGKQTRQK